MKNIFVVIIIVLSVQSIISQNSLQQNKNLSNLKIDKEHQKIILYTLENCSRCETAKKYFNTNNIKFTLVNTSEDDDANSNLWMRIHLKDPTKMLVKFPVILVGTELSYDIMDLDGFLLGF